nr:MAG TPA: hypothetical protein [Caudoviricetes sp.]
MGGLVGPSSRGRFLRAAFQTYKPARHDWNRASGIQRI